MEKIVNTIDSSKNNMEPLESNYLKTINEFVLNKKYSGDTKDKKAIFDTLQKEWHEWALQRGLVDRESATENKLDFIKNLCAGLEKFPSGFGSSPKLYEILPKDFHGLDCLSASTVLGSILDKEGIEYDFISPVGHIALMVKIEDKSYYVDPRNNKVICLEGLIENTSEDSEDFDLINFKKEVAEKSYRFVFKYKNKEDILKSIFGNIIVLKDLNDGVTDSSSQDINRHTEAAFSLKDKLELVNFDQLKLFVDQNFDDYHERNKDMIENEQKRLKDIGFYE